MNVIENKKNIDSERAFYGAHGLHLIGCSFDGPSDGESAFKEASDNKLTDCFFNLRYPFWHDDKLTIEGCEMTPLCRAALWYSQNIYIHNTKMHGIKALRECASVKIEGCDIASPEFGWSSSDIEITDTSCEGEYFMLRGKNLKFKNVRLHGKYSFQYVENAEFENCVFDTKDAFWHCKNVTVRNSEINGEYAAWYSDGLTLENCLIKGTQPFCYCKNLKLVGCKTENAYLAFEKSEVCAEILSSIDSIKNPAKGKICAFSVGETILDDEHAECKITITGDK